LGPELQGRDRGPIPRCVRVGGLDKEALLDALRLHEVQLNPAAEALFADSRFTPMSQGRDVEIVALSVAELGFAEPVTYARLGARAFESGLVECPLELGPHLRLQFLEQPEGAAGAPSTPGQAPPGSLTVASAPLDDRYETPKGFYLRRIDGVPWLRGYWSSPGDVWNPQDVLVFARR
jgi:hypothetical protein